MSEDEAKMVDLLLVRMKDVENMKKDGGRGHLRVMPLGEFKSRIASRQRASGQTMGLGGLLC